MGARVFSCAHLFPSACYAGYIRLIQRIRFRETCCLIRPLNRDLYSGQWAPFEQLGSNKLLLRVYENRFIVTRRN